MGFKHNVTSVRRRVTADARGAAGTYNTAALVSLVG